MLFKNQQPNIVDYFQRENRIDIKPLKKKYKIIFDLQTKEHASNFCLIFSGLKPGRLKVIEIKDFKWNKTVTKSNSTEPKELKIAK